MSIPTRSVKFTVRVDLADDDVNAATIDRIAEALETAAADTDEGLDGSITATVTRISMQPKVD